MVNLSNHNFETPDARGIRDRIDTYGEAGAQIYETYKGKYNLEAVGEALAQIKLATFQPPQQRESTLYAPNTFADNTSNIGILKDVVEVLNKNRINQTSHNLTEAYKGITAMLERDTAVGVGEATPGR